MRPPAISPTALNKALRRFRRNRRGSAAIEFALIAPLFFVMLFAIMETALIFFAAQVLETGTQDSARLMLTNQALNTGMTQAQFTADLCNRVKVLFSCDGTSSSPLIVSVRSYSPGVTIPAADLADPIVNRVFVSNAVYQVPKSGDTVLVRAFYSWPQFVTGLGYNISNIGSDSSSYKRLLAATAAFRTEPQ